MLEVSQTQVRDVMVPRSQMVVLERDAPKAEILKTIVESGHSRYPVIGEDRDEVIGVLLAKDILRHFVETPDQEFDLRSFIRPAIVIPESKRLNTLLKEFRISRNHLAIVVDEYGATAGLLTIEDVLEEIVGEIGDEYDAQEAEPIQKQDGNRFQVLALTRIEDFNKYFGSELSDEDYDTVGGLVMYELGRLPAARRERQPRRLPLQGAAGRPPPSAYARSHARNRRLRPVDGRRHLSVQAPRRVPDRPRPLQRGLAGLALPLAFAPFGLYFIAPLVARDSLLVVECGAARGGVARVLVRRGGLRGRHLVDLRQRAPGRRHAAARGAAPARRAHRDHGGVDRRRAAISSARLRGASLRVQRLPVDARALGARRVAAGLGADRVPVAEHRLRADRRAARRLGAASAASTR